MIYIDDDQFRQMVADAIDGIPEKYGDNILNLAFVVENHPSAAQREQLKLRNDQSLFGLYEGVPLPQRGAGYNLVLPDKITVFRDTILQHAQNEDQVRELLKYTLWHEVAHYYGLDHQAIDKLQDKNK